MNIQQFSKAGLFGVFFSVFGLGGIPSTTAVAAPSFSWHVTSGHAPEVNLDIQLGRRHGHPYPSHYYSYHPRYFYNSDYPSYYSRYYRSYYDRYYHHYHSPYYLPDDSSYDPYSDPYYDPDEE